MDKLFLSLYGMNYSMLFVFFVLEVVSALPEKKIFCIKIVRASWKAYNIEELGLKAAKDLVEYVMANVPLIQALQKEMWNAIEKKKMERDRLAAEAMQPKI
jgi:ribosomal protein L7/L12